MLLNLVSFRKCAWRRNAVALALCLSAGLSVAQNSPWPQGPYSQYAENKKLRDVLAEFASSFSLALDASPGLTGVVNGRFNTATPTEFMTKLAGVYGFVWYTHAGTLYVSRANEQITRSINAPGANIGGLRKALTDLGVLDARFGWGELPEQGLAMVSGPPSYVQLIQATIQSLPAQANGAQQVAVFKLRHASADDRTVAWRDRQITTPGLASILRDLTSGKTTGGANNESLSAIAAPLRAAGDPPAKNTSNAGAGNANGAKAEQPSGTRTSAPSIQADSRLNAVIVQDIAERLPLYRQLIDQLDVPTALIEIEAMIIDINSERARDLGINWGGRFGQTALGFGNLSESPASGTLSIVRGPAGANVTPSSLLVSSGNYLVNQIRILETQGQAQIQSRPSVLTVENLGALLDLSETFYIRVQGERVASVTPVTAGTTLRVTPRVIQEGQQRKVMLVVDIQDGQIQSQLTVDTLPTVRSSSVNTQAVVSPGEALLIAGYSSDQNSDSRNAVPGLGNVPVLGWFFSSKSSSVKRSERLFLIRPTIVTMPGENTSAATNPNAQALPPARSMLPVPSLLMSPTLSSPAPAPASGTVGTTTLAVPTPIAPAPSENK